MADGPFPAGTGVWPHTRSVALALNLTHASYFDAVTSAAIAHSIPTGA